MNAIEVKDLSFGYTRSHKVLDGLSLCSNKGSINVLLGLNGSGKTTLIKLLAGLLTPYSGQILLNGKNSVDLSIRERSKIMSYVAQRSSAIDDFTVQDYLLFGKVNQLNFYQSPGKTEVENVEQYAEKFGITQYLNKNLGELSGGQRQIVSICAAIIQNTEIVILDEPTSALDIKNQHIVLALLKEIASKEGKTFILSSHNPNHALYLDCNVFLLKDGQVLDSGSAKDIVTIDKLKPVYGDEICFSNEHDYMKISFKD